MRNLLLFLLVCLLGTHASAQSGLAVSAGPDVKWCSGMPGTQTSVDTPKPGANLAVNGGMLPYAYYWSLAYKTYSGSIVDLAAATYLDNASSSTPKFIKRPEQDSIRIVVRVTDGAGTVARDTAWVFLQRIICALGESLPVEKTAADTVLLHNQRQCFSNFQPYQKARWTPATELVDTTAQVPKCYATASRRYYSIYTDRIGCTLTGYCDVVVKTTGLEDAVPAAFPAVRVNPEEPGSLFISGAAGYVLDIRNISGVLVWSKAISRNAEAVSLGNELPAGLYVYTLHSGKSRHSGKISLL